MSNTRKIILDIAVTLDGFIEGVNGEVDWCIMDPDMQFPQFLAQIDTIFYGRKSYDLWGNFTPPANTSDEEKQLWQLIHTKQKYVFSKSEKTTDNNVTYINEQLEEAIQTIKSKPGKNIWLYGGAGIMTSFIQLGLIDEYRLSIHPVALGEGKPLFHAIQQRVNLQLVDTRTFTSGVVQLIYVPKNK